MSNIDIAPDADQLSSNLDKEVAVMASSLHVSLPDEMRAFVDMRASGKNQYSTPSEYVRALIREDMAREEDRRYAIRSLLKAEEEFRRGEMMPLSALDAVDAELDEELR
ncbi:ribbon-helix-helix domain-containing protein [Mesorhizobium abyssinicae]|uniref:ribbon-helix-helix domain-containing protein n=1 Tax=Mesorhizobium abyssinicae TaxID=1209958 RepID=UPI003397D652